MSAYPGFAQTTKETGAVAFVREPVAPETLLSMIDQYSARP
jgi:hypothetical protein